MSKIKNIILVGIVMFITIFALNNKVNAASSIRASSSSVTVGNNVSVTVSFGQKVSAAQFVISYDKNMFSLVSCSERQWYKEATNRFAYVSLSGEGDLGSVTFTFKAKTVGTGNFGISGVVLSTRDSSISNGTTTVKVEQAKTTTTKPSSNNNKKPTSSSSSSKQNTTVEETTEPEVIEKAELNTLKQTLEGLVQTDYTEESWKALQEAIASAEGAATNADYDAIKEKLSADLLVKAPFEKGELNKVLRDLIGKVETDYTQESWNALKEAIDKADSVELKSEYDAIKDKLTVNELILKDENFFIELWESPCGHGKIIVGLSAGILVLFIILIIMTILMCKRKKETTRPVVGRRLK